MNVIGIDLGTTNSACCVWAGGKPTLIPNRLGNFLTPSVVSQEESHILSVGEIAKNRLVSHSKSTAAVFKRYMGTNHSIEINGKRFSAVELSALVLKSLKEDAESFLNAPIGEAIISVPAYFNDQQRKATKAAAELVGLKVERLINEPTAAALVYGLRDYADGAHFLILDLGGGTFDVSLVEYFDGVVEVHASSGDNFLGGEDFLAVMIDDFLKHCGVARKKLSANELQKVNRALELALHQLSTQQSVEITELLAQQTTTWGIDRTRFEELVSPLLNRLRVPIERTIRDAKITVPEISEVVLVGGATRIHCVKNLIGRMFRRLPRCEIDPDLVVAMGAGIQAGLRQQNSDLDDIVLTDVAPYSMGIGIANETDTASRDGNLFHTIIERNSVVPCSIEHRFFTVDKGQKHINVEVYQGESRLVKRNILLGEVSVDVPKNSDKHEAIDVRFSYDMNGLLEVDTTTVTTGARNAMTIQSMGSSLSDSEIRVSQKKLAQLKFHPRDSEDNRLLLARAERLYETSLGDRRDYIGQAISEFSAILDRQNDSRIDAARKKFEDILIQLESESVF